MSSQSKHVSQEAWDGVDSPELTDDQLAKLKPAREALKSALFEKLTQGRGSQHAPTKEAVSLRLDRDVVEHFRAMGRGWQTKINRVLRESVEEHARTVVSGNKQPPKSASSGVYAASKGLRNPKSLTPKRIKSLSAATLTQAPGKKAFWKKK